jgi:hypothetical protein
MLPACGGERVVGAASRSATARAKPRRGAGGMELSKAEDERGEHGRQECVVRACERGGEGLVRLRQRIARGDEA